MTHEDIAIALGIARNTLEKHYEAELTEGAYAARAEVIEAMHAAALKGNASAAKAYLDGSPQVAAPPPKPDGDEKPRGKKEQAEVDARTAADGSDWGPLLAPGRTVQ